MWLDLKFKKRRVALSSRCCCRLIFSVPWLGPTIIREALKFEDESFAFLLFRNWEVKETRVQRSCAFHRRMFKKQKIRCFSLSYFFGRWCVWAGLASRYQQPMNTRISMNRNNGSATSAAPPVGALSLSQDLGRSWIAFGEPGRRYFLSFERQTFNLLFVYLPP